MKFSIIFSLLLFLITIGWTAVSRKYALPEKFFKKNNTISELTPEQQLGKKIFFDTNLSNPVGQSCASCHGPQKAFADPANRCLSMGAQEDIFGSRNAPAVAYAAFTPPLQYDKAEKAYYGGFFWDGHANTLAEQAILPLMSPLEMNSTPELVFKHLQKASYRELFISIYGESALETPEKACQALAKAIAAYESCHEVSPFTSKFDYYKKGETSLSASELRGLKLFNDPKKGNCAACHPSDPDSKTGHILFTDFSYDNIGLPSNKEITDHWQYRYHSDPGLGDVVGLYDELGKFKVPTLRNIALTSPYFHNGKFKTLEETVQFYNERDLGRFGEAEINTNMNKEELGNLKLRPQEIEDIVAFMKTLTDGYKVD